MANGAQTSIIDAAVVAWQDAIAACQRMPNLFLMATIALAALNLVYFGLAIVAFPGGPGFFGFVLGLIYAVAQSFLLTPLAIAVHRYLLLGETANAYRLDPQDSRFKKFFTFLAGLALVMFIPRLIGELAVLGRLVGFVLSIIAALVLVRNVILFPAVAVDAPGADWRNAMADTQGHSWRVFFILFCVILPAAIVAAIVLIVFAIIPLIGWLIAMAIQAAFSAFAVAATAAAASRMYVDYARLLGRPFGVASQSAA